MGSVSLVLSQHWGMGSVTSQGPFHPIFLGLPMEFLPFLLGWELLGCFKEISQTNLHDYSTGSTLNPVCSPNTRS